MSRAGSRALAVLAVLLGAALALLATSRTWVTVTLPGQAGQARADGRLAAPGAVAIALVAAAGAVVLATSGRVARTVVAALLLLAGLGIAALSVPVWAEPRQAADPAVARLTGTVGRNAEGGAAVSVWPALSAAGGLLVAAGGGLALARGRRWPGPARRFERPGAARPAGQDAAAPPASERDRRLDDWDRLSRGDDPTDG